MARRRRNAAVQPENHEPLDKLQIFDAGLYGRLSVLDNGRLDGDSLETQINIMEEYVSQRPDLRYVKVYQDNGYTGTNFDRPAWDELLRDVTAGKINCIVVKDLSRLGRNYIEVGEFLEKSCPQLGLRFISINDGYDSASLNSAEELAAALKNIINDYYAKDISRKTCSALAIKRRNGEYLGSYAPYGYRKDPENKNHLLIDPVTAPVVRQIYGWRAAGAGYGTITRRLNEQGIPSPGRYRFEQGIVTNNNKKGSKLLWNRHVLSDILKDPVYIGHLVQGKCRAGLYRGIPAHATPKEEWEISRSTHEAILPEGLFEAVQRFNKQQRRAYFANYGKYSDLPKEVNPYRDRLTCADCGAQLKLCRALAKNGARSYYSYLCPTYEEHRELGCTKKSIRSNVLDAAVLSALNVQMELFLDADEVLFELASRQRLTLAAAERKAEYTVIERQLTRKESLSAALYADWKGGVLSYGEYCFAKERYAREIAELKRRLNEMGGASEGSHGQVDTAFQWMEKIQTHRNAGQITEELVETFISSVQLDGKGEVSVRFSFENEQKRLEQEMERRKMGVV